VGFGGGSDCAAAEVTTLWRYTNMLIIIIIINMGSGVATTVVGGWKVSLTLSISHFFHPSATDSKFDFSSIGLLGRDTCLCVVVCQTVKQQNINLHPHYMLTTASSEYLYQLKDSYN